MKLTLKQVREITTGAVFVREEGEGMVFSRFTDEQLEMYTKRDYLDIAPDMFRAPAGIRLHMRTDSRTLFLRVCATMSFAGRDYFSFDVFVNGEPAGHLDCIDPDAVKGVHEKTFALGEGVKEVQIHLPYSVLTTVQEVGLDDGAFVEPVRREKKLLCYGDSITQGYDAHRPSHTYPARLADALHAECMNKGVGGDQVFPELVETEEDFVPDYITVAYGANDISYVKEVEFAPVFRRFLTLLSQKHPNAKIFALSPIWRGNWENPWPIGTCADMERVIREQCEGLHNVTFLSGWEMVPHYCGYFRDGFLHPNDEGFDHYAANLIAAVKQALAKE